ncbi:MAG: hypothetical protein OXG78_14400 [Chloroflexi bacterium]|nr:hypothetical protein [Chloroflexota bacterium]
MTEKMTDALIAFADVLTELNCLVKLSELNFAVEENDLLEETLIRRLQSSCFLWRERSCCAVIPSSHSDKCCWD